MHDVWFAIHADDVRVLHYLQSSVHEALTYHEKSDGHVEYSLTFLQGSYRFIEELKKGPPPSMVNVHGGEKPNARIDAELYRVGEENVYRMGACVVRKKGRQITILYEELGDLRFVVKSFIVQSMSLAGYKMLHSAAIVYKGIAYLLSGTKGSGKSTTLLATLALNPDIAVWATIEWHICQRMIMCTVWITA